jgi:hypothetical protein
MRGGTPRAHANGAPRTRRDVPKFGLDGPFLTG